MEHDYGELGTLEHLEADADEFAFGFPDEPPDSMEADTVNVSFSEGHPLTHASSSHTGDEVTAFHYGSHFPQGFGGHERFAYGTVSLQQLPLVPVEKLPPTQTPMNRTIEDMIAPSIVSAPSKKKDAAYVGLSTEVAGELGSDPSRGTDSAAPPPPAGWAPSRQKRVSFTQREVKLFYEGLSQFGTDFHLISVLLHTKDRNQVKKLYHRELKLNPRSVERALSDRKAFDEAAVKKKIEERLKSAIHFDRELRREEEDCLKMIEEQADSGEKAKEEALGTSEVGDLELLLPSAPTSLKQGMNHHEASLATGGRRGEREEDSDRTLPVDKRPRHEPATDHHLSLSPLDNTDFSSFGEDAMDDDFVFDL